MRKLVLIVITFLLIQTFNYSVAATNGIQRPSSGNETEEAIVEQDEDLDVVEESSRVIQLAAEEKDDMGSSEAIEGEEEATDKAEDAAGTDNEDGEDVEVPGTKDESDEDPNTSLEDSEENLGSDDATNEPQEDANLANGETESKSVFSKTKRPNAIPGIMSGDEWPEPGSLKLEKDATATDTYAEWEVELKVQGKNLKTSSDIVLVFDRSNSMYGSRATKAKNAAKEFVNNLLVEGSTVRIALVPFGTDTGTPNDRHTDFQDFSGKQTLLNAIDAIPIYQTDQSGGTNIHAGLHAADEMFDGNTADQKTIVLLSDGEPTYSLRAGGYEQPYTWDGGRHDFILKDFDYRTRVGNGTAGNRPDYGWNRYRCGGIIIPQYCYNPHVNDHVIPTISEAKHIMDKGIDMYSIGLEVGNVSDAIYTLQHSQNKGYYQGGSDDMGPIFAEIAASLAYAATNAVVTDPLGDMFNLVKESYNGADFEASHGTVSWDEASETFTWDIGSIKEGETYTLKYKVTIDWDKNPKGNVKYPTNKETPLNYKDPEGVNQKKQFPIPKVGIDSGKIVKKGYRVNPNGDPVDDNGNVVNSPAEAEQFYDEVFGEDLAFNRTYDVPANDVLDYTLHVGGDPTSVDINADNPYEVVWFGYVKTSELVAGDVTATYVDENGDEIANPETFQGNIGDSYNTEQKDILGYEFKEMHTESAPATGEFKPDPQTVIYVYTKKLGSLTIIKVDEENNRLPEAEFMLKDSVGNVIGTKTTDSDGEIVFSDLDWGKYTLIETKAPEGFRKMIRKIEIEITAEELHIIKTVVNSEADWEIPATGGIGTLGFYSVGLLLIGIASWLIIRNRRKSL